MSQTIAPVLGEATIQELREAVRGEILTASDEGYVEAALNGQPVLARVGALLWNRQERRATCKR